MPKNNIDIRKLDTVIADLEQAFIENGIHREPGLTVNRVAQYIQHPPYLVSIAINRIHKKKFNSFINEYRVVDMIEHFKQETYNKYTIEGLAKNVGFTSLSSFYETFRRKMNCTPMEYFRAYCDSDSVV